MRFGFNIENWGELAQALKKHAQRYDVKSNVESQYGIGYIIDGRAYEIEFLSLDGETAAIATVEAVKIRPVHRREITHARQLAVA